jgi:WD40 repeat protein
MPSSGYSAPHVLAPVKPIGVAWGEQHYPWMNFVSFSADGSRVAADGPASPADATGYLTEWTFPGGQLIKQVPVRPTALSPDWRYHASYHGVGETDSGRMLITLPDNVLANYVFSADSRYVAQSGPGGAPAIRIIELASGRQVQAFGSRAPGAMAFSPDGKTLACGHWDAIAMWSLGSGQRERMLRGFGRYVVSLLFSPDGQVLAGGTDTGGLQAWDVHRRRRMWSLDVGGADVSIPAFSPDGKLLAVGTYGTGQVTLIETATGEVLDRQQVSDLGCGSVAFSPDGRYLITPSTGGLVRWPHDQGGTIRVFRIERSSPGQG